MQFDLQACHFFCRIAPLSVVFTNRPNGKEAGHFSTTLRLPTGLVGMVLSITVTSMAASRPADTNAAVGAKIHGNLISCF